MEDIQSGTGPRSVREGGVAPRRAGEGHGWGGGTELGKGLIGKGVGYRLPSFPTIPSLGVTAVLRCEEQHRGSPGSSCCSGIRQKWFWYSLPWSRWRADAAPCCSAVLLGRSAGSVPLISFNEALQFFQTADLSECRVCAGPTFTPELFPALCSVVGQLCLMLLIPIASALLRLSSV